MKCRCQMDLCQNYLTQENFVIYCKISTCMLSFLIQLLALFSSTLYIIKVIVNLKCRLYITDYYLMIASFD